jgi:hypothetical protein
MKTAPPTEAEVQAEVLKNLPSARSILANWDRVKPAPDPAETSAADPDRPITFAAAGPTEAEVKAEIRKSIPSARSILANWGRLRPGA